MKHARIALALLAGVFLAIAGLAGAQQPVTPKVQPVQPAAKPQVPTKPAVQQPQQQAVAPVVNLPAEQRANLSAQAEAFAKARTAAITPAVRAQAATRVVGQVVPVTSMPETWSASAANPVTPNLWLGSTGVGLVTGPDVEAFFQVMRAEGLGDRGVRVRFNAEANVRYLLVCDMTHPAGWDVVVDFTRAVPVMAEGDSRGVLLIAAKPTATVQNLLLMLKRTRSVAGYPRGEALRSCEVSALRL